MSDPFSQGNNNLNDFLVRSLTEKMEIEQNLVVVNLDQCETDERLFSTITTTSCSQEVPLTTTVQCLNQSIQEHQISHLQQLQLPEQGSYSNNQSGLVTGTTSMFDNLALHSFSSTSFVPSVLQQPTPLIFLTQTNLDGDSALSSPQIEIKHPSDDFEYYKEIEDYLTKKELPCGFSETYIRNLKKRAHHYLIIENELYHNAKNPKKVIKSKLEQDEILKEIHIVEGSGIHLGIKKMVKNLEQNYFWRGLYITVAKYVKSCTKCRENFNFNKKEEVNRLGNTISSCVQTISSVWTKVEIAINGPYKITNMGNQYIMSITDPETCFILASPISGNGHSTKLVQFLLQTFYSFGFPKTANVVASSLLFDELKSEFSWRLKDFAESKEYLSKIDKPQNLWVGELFDLLVKKYSTQWDQEIGKFLYQFRIRGIKQLANSSFCPFYAMFHRIPDLFLHEENKENEIKEDPNKNFDQTSLKCIICNEKYITIDAYEKHKKTHLTPRSEQKFSTLPPFSDLVRSEVKDPVVTDAAVDVTVKSVRAFLAETKDIRRRRGKYQRYSAELQSIIADYAFKHGSQNASQHFTHVLKSPISDSTIRSIVKSYSEFVPSLKEEIANYAVLNGVETAAAHFSQKLKKRITPSLVRRFKTLYIKNSEKTPKNFENCDIEKNQKFQETENLELNFSQVDCGKHFMSDGKNVDDKFKTEDLTLLCEQSTLLPESCSQFSEPAEPSKDTESKVDDILLDYDVGSQNEEKSWPALTEEAPSEPKPKSKIMKESNGRKRGRYTFYSPELRAEIGKYAAQHGSLKASNYFSKILNHDLPESTARGYKDKYLKKLKHSDVTSLGYSQRGRPVRLGKYDELVQECLKELIKSGERVTSFLAITTAKQILNKYEPELLEENGGKLVLNTTWAKSALRRIGVHNSS